MPIRETAQDRDRVVADGEECDASTFEGLVDLLQLDQLRTAERSPIRTAMEHDDGPPSRSDGMQIHEPPRLVPQDHVRERCSGLWTDGCQIDLRQAPFHFHVVLVRGRCQRLAADREPSMYHPTGRKASPVLS